MIEINKNPSARDLAWFGAILALFLAIVAAVVWWRSGNGQIASVIAMTGLGLAIVYYVVPPLRKPMFIGWMYLAFPIGWTISMVILLAAYALVLTPIGLIRRRLGHDPMTKTPDRAATTYWIARGPAPEPGRYFRQW